MNENRPIDKLLSKLKIIFRYENISTALRNNILKDKAFLTVCRSFIGSHKVFLEMIGKLATLACVVENHALSPFPMKK